MFESLVYFVEKLSLGSLQEAAKQFPGKVDASYFTPSELGDYNRYRNLLGHMCFVGYFDSGTS